MSTTKTATANQFEGNSVNNWDALNAEKAAEFQGLMEAYRNAKRAEEAAKRKAEDFKERLGELIQDAGHISVRAAGYGSVYIRDASERKSLDSKKLAVFLGGKGIALEELEEGGCYKVAKVAAGVVVKLEKEG